MGHGLRDAFIADYHAKFRNSAQGGDTVGVEHTTSTSAFDGSRSDEGTNHSSLAKRSGWHGYSRVFSSQ